MAAAVEREKPDAVIHLGDYADDARELERLFPMLPVYRVRGNNDYKPDIIKSLRRLKREDLLNKLYPAGLGNGGGNNSRSQMLKSYNPNFNKKGRR